MQCNVSPQFCMLHPIYLCLFLANITKSSFLSYHTLLHDTVKGKLTSSYSATMCSPLSKAFRKSILASLPNEEEELDLMSFVSKSMFTAVVCELFGKENLSLTDVNCIIVFSLHWNLHIKDTLGPGILSFI